VGWIGVDAQNRGDVAVVTEGREGPAGASYRLFA
jgi:hypothetical protein